METVAVGFQEWARNEYGPILKHPQKPQPFRKRIGQWKPGRSLLINY
jgi:hypothetical protein